jgi:aquaporin Z
MRKYATEFIGTFGLVFTVCCGVRSGNGFTGLAAGAVLMVLVYAGGHISGGHYNPAVSLGVFLRGRLPFSDLIAYWVAQFAAALVAALLAIFTIQHRASSLPIHGWHTKLAALLAELIFTFALVYVVLNVATSKDHLNNHFYGLAIGFTVAAGALVFGGLSGGVFNPAVAIGGMIAGVFSWANIWLYLIAEFVGGAVAAVVFHLLNAGDVGEGLLAKLPTLP